jgi:hypothetical protein
MDSGVRALPRLPFRVHSAHGFGSRHTDAGWDLSCPPRDNAGVIALSLIGEGSSAAGGAIGDDGPETQPLSIGW